MREYKERKSSLLDRRKNNYSGADMLLLAGWGFRVRFSPGAWVLLCFSLLSTVCAVMKRFLRQADLSSRGFLPSGCHCVSSHNDPLHLPWLGRRELD